MLCRINSIFGFLVVQNSRLSDLVNYRLFNIIIANMYFFVAKNC